MAFVRPLDSLGRVIIPKEIRNSMGWNKNIMLSIEKEGDRVVLTSHKDSCFICGSMEDIKYVDEKPICHSCIKKIKENY
jgi:transcriptional regulator, abrB family